MRQLKVEKPEVSISSVTNVNHVTKERTKAGLELARKEGRVGGGRPKLTPQQQKEIVSLVTSGEKTGGDAARLFCAHPSTITRLLAKNRA